VNIPDYIPFEKQECNLGKSYWSVPRLVKLSENLPTILVSLDTLNIACTEYTANMRNIVMHMRSVLSADLELPILLSEDGEIFDGRHRIMLAIHLGNTHISAKRFQTNPEPDRI
jgi:hypothetical protein